MRTHFKNAGLLTAALAFSFAAFAAPPKSNARIAPNEISLGESAQLTVTISGNGSEDDTTPPAVPGLEFSLVGQSSQISSINGSTTSTMVLTFEVTPQHAGKFTIPAFGGGTTSLVLNVRPGNARGGALQSNAGANLPPPATGGFSAGATHLSKDGSSFARLLLPKRELYVGESVPVEIQVGLRAGMVASLTGLPALNGDAFIFTKLSAKPEQAEKIINGQRFTLLTWRSVLAAIKPGDFALTVETPLSVRVQTARRRGARASNGFFGDSMLDDMMDDPMLQNFFGGTSEKEITVTSDPDALKILALPTQGRPDGFSGAVGKFDASAELSAAQTAVGDPLTLRLKITGNGSFDRVNSAMLADGNGWKSYKPSAKFTPGDSAGYGGEKIFEQAVIPTHSGAQTIPAIAFSFFNPDTRQFETKHTIPLNVQVGPASLTAPSPAVILPAAHADELLKDGLRPDHAEFGAPVTTLRPLYFQAWFIALQFALICAFGGAWMVLNLRETRAKDTDGTQRRESSRAVSQSLAAMDAAASACDSHAFFRAARSAFQHKLAASRNASPESITIAELDANPGAIEPDVRRIFALADEAAFSGQDLTTADFQQWKQIVRTLLEQMEAA